jgi:hypothetical protein
VLQTVFSAAVVSVRPLHIAYNFNHPSQTPERTEGVTLTPRKQVPWMLRMKSAHDIYRPVNCFFPLKTPSGISQIARSV